MSSKHFFSTDSMMSYDEYLKFKSGNEQIKNKLSSEAPDQNILPPETPHYNHDDYLKSFIDYRSFLTLTMAFYKQINNRSEINAPLSLANANSSFKSYKLFQNHIQNCNYCSKCANVTHVFYCKGIQNILYPYGNAVLKQDNLHNMRYPSTLQLSKYCCNNCRRENCCCERPYQPHCYPPYPPSPCPPSPCPPSPCPPSPYPPSPCPPTPCPPSPCPPSPCPPTPCPPTPCRPVYSPCLPSPCLPPYCGLPRPSCYSMCYTPRCSRNNCNCSKRR